MTMNEIPDRISPKSHLDAQVSSFSNSQKTKCDLIQCSRERVLWKGIEAFLLFVQNIADGTKKESRTKKFDQNL